MAPISIRFVLLVMTVPMPQIAKAFGRGPTSFRDTMLQLKAIHQSVYKDKNGVYADGRFIDKADPTSFASSRSGHVSFSPTG